ncbi:putative membrane protein [Duffyella gerundensis]|uniref:Putative membrane protein n=1 Tax=Duffyella gerundensis TaxID=1619313 RepID=A0A0U5KZE4_9GAMM|nr:putative membrane protein [Duffyella gerundensis]
MIYFNVDIKFAQLIFNAVFGKKIFALGLFIYPAAKCRHKKTHQ